MIFGNFELFALAFRKWPVGSLPADQVMMKMMNKIVGNDE